MMISTMAPFFPFLLLLLHIIPSPSVSEYSIDDSALFKINFHDDASMLNPDKLSQRQPMEGEENAATAKKSMRRTVVMTSTNSERYECTLPKTVSADGSENDVYAGPIALEILEQLFTTQSCAYRLEHYWTYELCHGRYIRQFHEERDGKNIKLTEYILGSYDADALAKDIARAKDLLKANGGVSKKPLKKKIDTLTLPFYELTMSDGTTCDLNGQPRVTHVNYVCYPAGKHEMYSFKEVSTCEYDVIVLSPTLCNHPDYRPEESSENMVDCRPLDDQSPYKPRNLIQIEAESLKLRTSGKMFEGDFMQGDAGPGSVRIEIKPVGAVSGVGGVEDAEDELFSDEDLEDAHSSKNWPERGAQREPFKPLMDPEVVKEFLVGDYCLYGGSGWWKYEFCYGKKVEQYHQEGKVRKTVISLGNFDKEKHLEWLKANPAKRPKPVEARKHVSHFYSGGDLCDLTQKPRQVEVKLKCKKSDSPSTVSLYLLEPKTCEYVLGVESPLVCDIIHLADDDGMMDITRDNFIEPQPPQDPLDSAHDDIHDDIHAAAHAAALAANAAAAPGKKLSKFDRKQNTSSTPGSDTKTTTMTFSTTTKTQKKNEPTATVSKKPNNAAAEKNDNLESIMIGDVEDDDEDDEDDEDEDD